MIRRTTTKSSRNVQISIIFRVFAWTLIIFIIPFQVILQQPLISNTTSLILSIQHGRTSSGISFFSLFQYFGNGMFLNVLAPGLYNCLHPKRSPYIIIFFSLAHYLGNFIALTLQEPRPFWTTPEIRGELCSEGFGNPSLTTLISASILPAACIEMFHTYKYRYIAYCILTVLLLISSFSGIYLGEQFPHQIVTSLFFAFIIVTFYFSFAAQLRKVCANCCYDYYRNRIHIMHWLVILLALCIVMALFQLVINVTPSDYSRLVSHSTRHCNANYEPNGMWNALSSLEVFYTMGFVCGCIQTSKSLSMYWVVNGWWKRIVRFIVSAGVCLGVLEAFSAIPYADDYGKMMLHYIVPNFLAGFSYTGLLPWVFVRCGLGSNIRPKVDKEMKLENMKNKVII